MPSVPTAKWEAVSPIRKHDNLIACAQFKHLKPFKPSYEKDPHVYLNWILAWQYGKLWVEERNKWEKLNYGAESASQKKDVLRRKQVIKKPKKRT